MTLKLCSACLAAWNSILQHEPFSNLTNLVCHAVPFLTDILRPSERHTLPQSPCCPAAHGAAQQWLQPKFAAQAETVVLYCSCC
jgi:hypothetical protein